jgi:ribonuclease Z
MLWQDREVVVGDGAALEITFLGTSSGVPTRSRNVSSVVMKLPQKAELWLFDCGEGTQQQLIKSDLRSSQIRRIFITHMHGDHTFGLMGLLASCGLAGNVAEIDLYGPPELGEYIKASRRLSHTHFAYPLRIHTVQPGIVFEDDQFTVSCELLKHRIPAHGYRIVERDRVGQFDVEQAQALGIPFGPLYGKLKNGESITLDDGRVIHGPDLCGPTEIGRKVVYCTDTVICDAAIALADDADVLIHEATFAHADAELAFQRMHSTSTMAAQVAQAANAKTLIMTHFSPRYAPGNAIQLKDLLTEARAIFPNTEMATDFWTYTVPRRRDSAATGTATMTDGRSATIAPPITPKPKPSKPKLT